MHIVFVHGIFNTGRVFVLMAQDAHKYGFIPHTPSLRKADGRLPIAQLAEQLQTFIATHIPAEEECILVGFSMGGIIARYYLQMLGGVQRVKRFIAIGSPHKGSIMAYFLPTYFFPGVKDLRPNSEVLRALQDSEGQLASLPVRAFFNPIDTMIIPPSSADWKPFPSFSTGWHFHPFMPFSRRVRKLLWNFIQSA